MAIDPNATAKDYSLIIYNKTEIDGFNSAETTRVDDELDTKSDKADEGAPSGIAQLDPAGKHVVNQIPISSVAEAEDTTNATTVMTPQRVNYLIETKTIEQSQIGIAGGITPLGVGAKVDPIYLPPAQVVNTYVVNLLTDMYALVGLGNVVNIGDRCIVVAEVDPLDNGEYVANTDSPIDITGWDKIPNLSAVSSVNGSTGHVAITSIAESANNAIRLDAVEATTISNTADIALKASQTSLDDVGVVITLLTTELSSNTTDISNLDARLTAEENNKNSIMSFLLLDHQPVQTVVADTWTQLEWDANAVPFLTYGADIGFDNINKKILVHTDGIYRIAGVANIDSTINNLVELEIRIGGVASGLTMIGIGRNTPGEDAPVPFNFSVTSPLLDNDDITIWAKVDDTEFTLHNISFTIEKLPY